MVSVVKTAPTLDNLESLLHGLPQIAADCVHAFAPGIYIRQVTLTAGALVMGHRHRTAHLNVMLSGRLTMFNDDGTRSELCAPVICVAQPGRKVAYVHERTVWLNIYATTETDVEKLEAQLLDKSEDFGEVERGFRQDRAADRRDFDDFLFEQNLTPEYVRAESENTTDQITFPLGAYKFQLGASQIEGRGLICTADIVTGEIIAPARIEGKRTPAGRYTNHSLKPNAQMISDEGGNIYLIATRPIGGSLGGQPGDEITINYRAALALNKQVTQA
jgi:SET domain